MTTTKKQNFKINVVSIKSVTYELLFNRNQQQMFVRSKEQVNLLYLDFILISPCGGNRQQAVSI